MVIHFEGYMLHYYKNSLLSLFRQIKIVKGNPQKYRKLCLSIQETLIKKITYIEKRIRTLKINIKICKKELRTKGAYPLAKEKSIRLKRRIKVNQSSIKQYQEILSIFRDIGDALAFIYIDKWDIKPMSFKETAGFISGKKGTRLERKCLRGAFEAGQVGLLNDVTHCLRYGDITVPRNGFFQVFELKSGRWKNTRENRQANALKNVHEYLVTDRTDKLFGVESEIFRVSIHSDAVYYTNEINSLINEAVAEGVAYTEVEKGLIYYVAIRFEKYSLDKVISLCRKKPIIAHLNQMIFLQMGGYCPVTLSIRDAGALYKFYAGQLIIIIAFDPSTIENVAEKRGYVAKFIEDSDQAMVISSKRPSPTGPQSIFVGRHLFGRIFSEFLSPNWLLNEIVYKFESSPQPENEHICV